ncbi:MAG: hypothetical protein LLG01_12270 [Planctomycetaceae bacterium]|nr:hypothetical protein [Planctomycetaceae bacterium]
MKPFLVVLFTAMFALPLLGQPAPGEAVATSGTAEVTMGYARVGGHAPGNYSVTIQGRQVVIVTPGRTPVTSRVPVAEDEVEYFRALFRLGKFLNYPTSSPPAGRGIEDRPKETLTLTVGEKSHTADCTAAQDPYLRDLMGLFREVLCKQEMILMLDAAATAKTRPAMRMDGLQWKRPLRGQRGRASGLMNELLERNLVHEVVSCDASGNIETLGALANLKTIEILAAKLKGPGRDLSYAVDGLGSSGDPRAIPPLLNLLAEGNQDPRIVRALARLDCHAVLDEALERRDIESLGYIGRDDPRAVALVEGEAYGWFTERGPRSDAVRALAQMQRLPTPTKANLFAHVFAGLLILLGIVVLIVPHVVARLPDCLGSLRLRAIAMVGILAGAGMLYMLHFAIFF